MSNVKKAESRIFAGIFSATLLASLSLFGCGGGGAGESPAAFELGNKEKVTMTRPVVGVPGKVFTAIQFLSENAPLWPES